MNELLTQVYFGNTVQSILTVIGVFTVFVVFKIVLVKVLNTRVRSFTSKTETKYDDIILQGIIRFLDLSFIVIGVYFSKFFLIISDNINSVLNVILVTIFTIILTFLLQNLFSNLINEYFTKRGKKDEEYIASLLNNILSIAIWLIGISLILSNLGYDITALAAGIGIGGIAVALAVQPILASIFASFSLFFDKPFKVGDMVTVGGYSGTIKDMGLRSTRMTTFVGNEVIFPNTEIVNSSVENISQRRKIREDLTLGLTYDTSVKKIRKAMDIVKKVLIDEEEILDDDVRVYFNEFADSSLNLLITYFINYKLPLHDRLQLISDVNFSIKEKFEKEGIEFAFPTQTIYLEK